MQKAPTSKKKKKKKKRQNVKSLRVTITDISYAFSNTGVAVPRLLHLGFMFLETRWVPKS